jgi:CspA family cold shock protein
MPTGKVKWFNNAKGYGFILEDGGTEDLFAHFSSIEMEGYKTLKAGQSVRFEKQPGNKGTHAVSISPIAEVQTQLSIIPRDNTPEDMEESEAISYRREAVGA